MTHRKTTVFLTLAALLAGPWACTGDDERGQEAQDAGVSGDVAPPGDGEARDGGADGSPVDGAVDSGQDGGPPLPAVGFPGLGVVDPMIGTGSFGVGVGNTTPAATLPFGMVKVGPDTRGANGSRLGTLHCAGYRYEDTMVEGFTHMHLSGTGVPDYGNVLFIPLAGPTDATDEDGYSQPLDHATEVARPGYYRVVIGQGVEVELTATRRAARHRYTFPDGGEPWVLVDLGHTLDGGRCADSSLTSIPEEARIEGWVHNVGAFSGRYGGFRVFFSARFDSPWEEAQTWSTPTQDAGERVGVRLRFHANRVQAAVGISLVDLEGARRNLEAEAPGWDFEATVAQAEERWRTALSTVELAGGTEAQRTIFYTALYHTMMMPTLLTDVDSRYRGVDGGIHRAEGFTFYSDLSLWDTYRNLHTLVTLLAPDLQRDFLVSLMAMYDQGGAYPRWPMGPGYGGSMVGTSADIVFADSYLRGVGGFDADQALDGLLVTADGPRPAGALGGGRAGIEDYLALGYVPSDRVGGAASRTLEYAYDDFALAQFASALGREDVAERMYERARSYVNVWDPTTKFFRGRDSAGGFEEEFDPFDWSRDFVEGDAWHYRFFVPFDVPGLASLFGGERFLVVGLERFFEEAGGRQPMPDPYYWHGNEPDMHAAYLFAEAGRPDLTQRWARWIMEELYRPGPDGLPGNDDAGTMSAWYVFSALGFYPVPATTRYVLGSPIFPRVVLHLPGGDLEIVAERADQGMPYVHRVIMDGVELDDPWVEHRELAGGGRLVFHMAEEPGGPWVR